MNTTLNFMLIFIVLGIAADDVFVFCDAWEQSKHIESIGDDMQKRMAYAWKRSFNAILVTSTTTAFAFLANLSSKIRSIQAFGIFAAIIIPVNFFLIILIIPPIQVFHDRYLEKYCSYKKCCKCCDNKDENGELKPGIIDRCFKGCFNTNVRKARLFVIPALIILGIAGAIGASQIGPLTKEQQTLPDDHEINVLNDIITEEFS